MEVAERILHASRSLFERLGVRSVSMDDISRSLGMSKKTIYQYYQDKDHIVRSYCQYLVNEKRKEFDKLADSTPSALHELLEITKMMRDSIKVIHPGLLHELCKYHPESYMIFIEYKQKDILPQIERSIQRGINEGVFRPNLNVKILAKLRAEEVELGFNPTVFPHHEMDVLEVQYALFDHFMHGLLTPEGLKAFEALKAAQQAQEGNKNNIPFVSGSVPPY